MPSAPISSTVLKHGLLPIFESLQAPRARARRVLRVASNACSVCRAILGPARSHLKYMSYEIASKCMALFLFFLCSCSPLAYTPTRAVNSTAELPPFKTITVLHFFSTWCSTCLPELATIETFVNHPPRPDLVVFAIALGESADTVGRFLARRALRGDHYFCDPASTLQKEFAITALPVTLVLNQDGQPLRVSDPITGRLVDRLVGAQDWEKLRAVFATMPRAEASQ